MTYPPRDKAAVLLLARWLLGLLFFMAGWFKVFEMGALQHASQFFVDAYRESWIPTWLLWCLGAAIPFLELLTGGLLLLGWRIRECAYLLAGILVMVTYGHLLKEPFFDITTHIFPRAILLAIIFLLPAEDDRWSLDAILELRRSR